MSGRRLSFSLIGTDDFVQFEASRGYVAAYTGRNAVDTERHIRELAELGVPRPRRVPDFFEIPVSLFTQEGAIAVGSSQTSGEAEPVLAVVDGEWLVTVGSDHTDRALEVIDMAAAKRACHKVIGQSAVRYTDVRDDWDDVRLVSYLGTGGLRYQDGTLKDLLSVESVVDALQAAHPPSSTLEGTVLFLGTIPTLDGGIRPSNRWSVQLETSLGAVVCDYDVIDETDGGGRKL